MRVLQQSVEKEFDDAVEKQRYQRLKYLLDRTEIYSTFLADKLRKHTNATVERDPAGTGEHPTIVKDSNESEAIKKHKPTDYITTKVSASLLRGSK
jgi:hypothetical protein